VAVLPALRCQTPSDGAQRENTLDGVL
jgi:hypothetical protein